MPIKKDKYFCKSCNKEIKYTQCLEHRKAGHEVWHIDTDTGELDYRYGVKPPLAKQAINESGADIKEHIKGFVEPQDEILFIYYKGGKIERFWDRFGDHESIYRAMVADDQFEGSPAEFVDASARYMLAVAGYEPTPCIIPKSQRDAYEETARLIREGELKVWYEESGRMRLETNREKEELNAGATLAESRVSAGGDQHQSEGLSSQERQEEPGEAQ